jgi:hypothetical protein
LIQFIGLDAPRNYAALFRPPRTGFSMQTISTSLPRCRRLNEVPRGDLRPEDVLREPRRARD